MAENSTERLLEVTGQETAEFEKMAGILSMKLSAISGLDMEKMQAVISEELAKMKDIRMLEKERAGILESISLSGNELNRIDSLRHKLGEENSARFTELHAAFRSVYAEVRRLNDICQTLLLHSLAFIRQNIRILTDDGRRKLVDKKA